MRLYYLADVEYRRHEREKRSRSGPQKDTRVQLKTVGWRENEISAVDARVARN